MIRGIMVNPYRLFPGFCSASGIACEVIHAQVERS